MWSQAVVMTTTTTTTKRCVSHWSEREQHNEEAEALDCIGGLRAHS